MNIKDKELTFEEQLKNSNKIISYYEKEEDKLINSLKLNNITIDNVNNFKKINRRETFKLLFRIIIASVIVIGFTKFLGINPNLLGVVGIITCFCLPKYLYLTSHNRYYIRKNNMNDLNSMKNNLEQELCEVREKRLLQEKYSNMIYERINNTEDNPIIDDYSDVSTNNNLVRIRK